MIVEITITAVIRSVIMIYQLYRAVIAFFIATLELEEKKTQQKNLFQISCIEVNTTFYKSATFLLSDQSNKVIKRHKSQISGANCLIDLS